MTTSGHPTAPYDPSSTAEHVQEIRRVHRQHADIVRHINDLAERLESVSGPTREGQGHFDVAGRLGRLQEEIAQHFADEERVGFVPKALKRAPQLSERASRIISQHDLLRLGLAHAIDTLGLEHSSWEDVRRDFESFTVALREHERRENELINEAMLDDLGGGG